MNGSICCYLCLKIRSEKVKMLVFVCLFVYRFREYGYKIFILGIR